MRGDPPGATLERVGFEYIGGTVVGLQVDRSVDDGDGILVSRT